MASGRKPPVPREHSAGARGRSPGLTDANPGSEANRPGVITASKSLLEADDPAPDPTAHGSAVRGESVPGRPPEASILAFPQPKGKRLRRNIFITACLAFLLTAAIVAAAVLSPVMAIKTITVSGTRLLTTDQVLAALSPVQGVPLPQVAEAEVEALLEPLVQVKHVSVEARPPSELVVKIEERVPVALVKQGEQFLLVDVEGVQLTDSADPATTALPVIDGGAGAIGQELFQATAAVLGALPPEILARLSNASAQSVDAVELKLIDGQTVVWGNAQERGLKAKVLQALLDVPADPKNPVRVYDISAPRNPVTR